ncbi:MAG: hypothetical protein H9872_08875 [Candidatus Cellulosilyticum pullistercoris]|uniref:Uncharacterized protein n=1 Tax=Candidatus Cellulosilyticum pullistercoris TaxID=2838521 RepID=A0A9E2KEB9_9FIRM|nr:hypothetical protein [Candidatus Cellulosilyticum pullistercoris]
MLVGLLISLIGFQFIFEQMNKIDLKVVNLIHEKTRELKHKKVIQYVIMIILAGILWSFMDIITVSYIIQGVIIGILWAFIMFLFEDTIFDNMRNTLR